MYGKDYRYASTRLTGTILCRGSNPLMIREVGPDMMVVAETVITKKIRTFPMSELSLRSPDLGMVNTGRGVAYLARKPMRNDWRQGVRRNNISDLTGSSEVTDKLIYRAIKGRFPSLVDAIDDTMSSGVAVAFHRHWAVRYNERLRVFQLVYKWHGVAGNIAEDTHEVSLRDNGYLFTHLKEALEDVINGQD